MQAFVAALRAHNTQALLAVLGSNARPLIDSGDKVADRESSDRFLHSYDEANSLVKSGDDKAVLQTGKDDWPFPIPLVKSQGSWRFDTGAGSEGVVFQKDLGPKTAAIAKKMKTFNPDSSWTRVEGVNG